MVLANNLGTANKDPGIITAQLRKDLALGRVSQHDGSFPFFCSPLGLSAKATEDGDESTTSLIHMETPSMIGYQSLTAVRTIPLWSRSLPWFAMQAKVH